MALRMMVAVLLALPAAARAGEQRWGAQGTLLLSGSLTLDRFGSSFGKSDHGEDYSLSAEAQYFVAPPLVVGLDVVLRTSTSATAYILTPQGPVAFSTTSRLLGLEPVLGVNIDLTPSVSLLPKVFFEYDLLGGSGGSSSRGLLGIGVPLVLHVPHLFVAVGPALFTTVGSDNGQVNLFLLRTSVGGWF